MYGVLGFERFNCGCRFRGSGIQSSRGFGFWEFDRYPVMQSIHLLVFMKPPNKCDAVMEPVVDP